MSGLPDRHSAATAHAMQRAFMFDLFSEDPVDGDRVPVKETFAECVELLWPGWTPVVVHDRDDERDGELFVFTHPWRGWGVSFVLNGSNRWRSNPAEALEEARENSASGLTLTIVCERMLNPRAQVSAPRTLAVVELLLASLLRPVLVEQQTVFMLAMTGRLKQAQEAASWWGYGDLPGITAPPQGQIHSATGVR